jgi:hypothetical protein
MIAARTSPRTRFMQVLLRAAAVMTRETGWAVSVVLAREPGLVAQARAVAQDAGVRVSVDTGMNSICVRFAT